MLTLSRYLRDQSGFSMAEVVVAFAIFVASVVGVSAMMISGIGNVSRGALASRAAQLAAEKLDQVRNLPFYREWDPDLGNQDIDDYYYIMDGLTNAEQLDNIAEDDEQRYEGYGTIGGHPNFRRTCAVQYKDISDDELNTAVMASNWVNKEPTTDEVDSPTNSDDVAIHAIVIEVRVYYYGNQGTEHEYVARALAGDYIVGGGGLNPVLVVTEINQPSPPEYYIDDETEPTFEMEIKVIATGLEDHVDSLPDEGSLIEVKLWYPGKPTLNSTYPESEHPYARVEGSTITCEFDFTYDQGVDPLGNPYGARPGLYNLEVNWRDEGWVDRSFRECFTAMYYDPIITGCRDFDWGYCGQPARQVTIEGEYLDYPNDIWFIDPDSGTEYEVSVGDGDNNAVEVTFPDITYFDPESPPGGFDSLWDIKVETDWGDDKSDRDEERFLLNPAPEVDELVDEELSPSDLYRKKDYSNVKITGSYFQDSIAAGDPLVWLYNQATDQTITCEVTAPVEETGDLDTAYYVSIDLRLEDLGGPFTWGNSSSENGPWQVHVMNPDLQAAMGSDDAVIGNAPISITDVELTDFYYNYYDSPVRVTGSYFETAENGTRVIVKDASEVEIYGQGYAQSTYCVEGDNGVSEFGITTGGVYDGSDQTADGHLNLINLPTDAMYVQVMDLENGVTSSNYLMGTLGYADVPEYLSQSEAPRGVAMETYFYPHNHWGWTHPAYPDGPELPWTFRTRQPLFSHKHYSDFRFLLRGKGFAESVTIEPGRWRNWFGWAWRDNVWGQRSVDVTADRSGKEVYAEMSSDTGTWFHSEDIWGPGVGPYNVAIRNNSPAPENWLRPGEATRTNYQWQLVTANP